jgi:diguanylate cyclase (GGDEF)-like protein
MQFAEREKPKVLVIAHDPELLRYIRGSLSENYAVQTARTAEEAEPLIKKNSIDAIFLDPRIPKSQSTAGFTDGIRYFERVRQATESPIVLLTQPGDELLEDMLADSRSRPYEMLRRPFGEGTLRLKTRNAVEHYRNGIDDLTGLSTKKALERKIKEAFEHVKRDYERSAIDPKDPKAPYLSIVYMDLDGFKDVNDFISHRKGDDALFEVGEQIRAIRSYEAAGRMGGDEFAVMLFARADEAHKVARRVYSKITNFDFTRALGTKIPVNISLSAGIATYPYPTKADGHLALIECADKAMHQGKVEKKEMIKAGADPRDVKQFPIYCCGLDGNMYRFQG